MKKAGKKAPAGRKRSPATKKSGADVPDLPDSYRAALAEIKQRVHRTQIRAALSANAELIALYWDLGRMILDRQSREGWGAKVIDRLAADLQAEFPGRQGFSPRNLKYMRAFAEAWPGGVIVQRPVAQLESTQIVQAPLAQLPWRCHTLLLDKLDTPEDRLWYAHAALENGWSGNILALRDVTKPIGVSGYITELVEKLPKNLRGTIPTVEEIEKELSASASKPLSKNKMS